MCEQCRVYVINLRGVERATRVLCRACAGDAYIKRERIPALALLCTAQQGSLLENIHISQIARVCIQSPWYSALRFHTRYGNAARVRFQSVVFCPLFSAVQSNSGNTAQVEAVIHMNRNKISRCAWSGSDPLYVQYHDQEWGVPLHNEQKLFEFLVLEGMQAGLSWITILRKRENFRRAFDHFDAHKIARYKQRKIESLMQDAGIIRNRQKILATVDNARAFLKLQDEFGSFDKYMWGFVNGKPVVNRWKTLKEIPAKTPLSETISKDMVGRGFRFVGPTIVYAHLQATGVVQDHLISCFRYKQLRNAK